MIKGQPGASLTGKEPSCERNCIQLVGCSLPSGMIPTGPTIAADDDCDNDRGVFSLSTLSDSLEVPSPPPKCDKDHDMEAILAGMKPNGDRSDFWCDICQALHLEDNCRVNYHCRICGDYDTCFSCAIIHTIQGTDEYRKLSFTYIGPLDDGKARGKGKRNYDNGNVYVGDFSDGNMHGTGTLTRARLVEGGMSVSGGTTRGVVPVLSPWLMVVSMSVSGGTVSTMVPVLSPGLMVRSMSVSGGTTSTMVPAN